MLGTQMRTTVNLSSDVASALNKFRQLHLVGLSEAVNHLIRLGLQANPGPGDFTQKSYPMGLRIDVDNVSEALEVLDGPTSR